MDSSGQPYLRLRADRIPAGTLGNVILGRTDFGFLQFGFVKAMPLQLDWPGDKSIDDSQRLSIF